MYATNEVKVGYSLKFRVMAALHLRRTHHHAAVVMTEFLKSKGHNDVKIVKSKDGYTITSGGKN